MDGCLQHLEIVNRVTKLEKDIEEITKRQCDTERITTRFDVRFDNIIDKITELKLKIDETETIHTVRSLYLIDLGFDKFNIQPVTIESDNVIYDITEIIKNIKHSTLTIS
jgi:predicted nuclease with TOPRIM domain